jgi:hypothetical protein
VVGDVSAEQLGLDTYRRVLADGARSTSEEAARLADLDGLDEARSIIRSFPPGSIVSADDVRWRQMKGTPAVLGPAFREAARLGLFEPYGVTTAQALRSRGRIQRTWQRTSL